MAVPCNNYKLIFNISFEDDTNKETRLRFSYYRMVGAKGSFDLLWTPLCLYFTVKL